MNYPLGLRVLILDGKSSQCLPLMESFYKQGCYVTVVSPYWETAGHFSRFAHKKLIWKSLYVDEEETFRMLLKYLISNRNDLVLGLSDKTSLLLSKYSDKLKELTALNIPKWDNFTIAVDKFRTMKFCMENSIPCPFSIDAEDYNLEQIKTAIQFPVIVKPKWGVGSVGVRKFNRSEELIVNMKMHKQRFGPLLIQEFIPNEEQYTAEVFCDKNSNLKACVIILKSRFFPVGGGSSSCNLTVEKPEFIPVIQNFVNKLQWVGSANIDFIFDRRDNLPKIIEINPRVGAIVKVANVSGVDIATLNLDLAFSTEVRDSLTYKPGLILRNLMLELLWLFSSSPDKWFKSSPAFFKFFGKEIYYQTISKRDPFVWVGFMLSNLRKYLNIEAIRRKLFFFSFFCLVEIWLNL